MSDNVAAEVWLAIPAYEGLYQASNAGRIRRDPAAPARSLGVPGNVLQPSSAGRYPLVSLSKAGIVRTHRLHRLVLTTFCGPPPFEGAHACHNDGNTRNYALINLRWASPTDNQADVDRHGMRCKGAAVHGAVLDDSTVAVIRRRITDGERNATLALEFGVSVSTIHLIRHGRIWRHVA